MMNRDQLRDFAINAQAMIDAGAVEDRIRHYLSSRLLSIFPDSPWWVHAHMQGIEEHVRYALGQNIRGGFVDAVIGKTAIEYEKNLTINNIFEEGFNQVKEYTAALCNSGISEEEVLGVLSDTVRWYGYRVHIVGNYNEELLLGPDNIELEQIMYIDLSVDTDEEYSRFEQFVEQFMARSESRILNSNTLVTDFGVDSSFYRESINYFSLTVNTAILEKPDYADLIKHVWQNFIAYLGVSDYGSFSVNTYVNEYYLVTIAKILCVDILAGRPVISNDEDMVTILDGEYFSRQNLYNFVDYDYFGWLNRAPYINIIMPCAKEIQNRLCAYDFSRIGEQDIFGRLLAQLADKEHRLMLGQEFTPHWLAKEIVDYNIDKIADEEPHIMDMCCGSGVFLIEAVKSVREKYNINSDDYNDRKDAIIFSAVIGFDIDPLAVMLAKVNWIMAMRDLFPLHRGTITVPIYHADSLFVATPITREIPIQGADYFVLTLDDSQIKIPAFLFSAECRKVFDSFVAKVYRLAMVRAENSALENGDIQSTELIRAVEHESGVELGTDKIEQLIEPTIDLVSHLESLQRQGMNGIWHFILSNSYRPGLAEKQFNCIISNPPWMAMSKLADNPYKNALKEIAKRYDLQPVGASHPHMELATIFLVCSVDRYLKEEAIWSFILPASVMSGLNHEAFRTEKYRMSDARLETKVTAIWEIPISTFKNKAVVISGNKSTNATETIEGRVYETVQDYDTCVYTLNRQGRRSAWTNRGRDAELIDTIAGDALNFKEGCDLFPRTVLFHHFIRRPNGNWNIMPIERTDDRWYLISESKKNLCNNLCVEDFEDEFIYDALISKHISPFFVADPAKVLMPSSKMYGVWRPITYSDIAFHNASTAYVFGKIEEAVECSISELFEDRINIFNKLYQQNFATKDFLILSSAGGSNPCAAFIDLRECERDKIVIDQTLYWYLTDNIEEAIYITGMINSTPLQSAILDFQPEGGFGKRHIHTLPYKIIPRYDSEDRTHLEVVRTTRTLISEWQNMCNEEPYKSLLNPNSGALNSRRRKQQKQIRCLQSFEEYDIACTNVLR